MEQQGLSQYGTVSVAILIAIGLALLATAFTKSTPSPVQKSPPAAWAQFRFGYPTYALLFLSFDMEMIFMYPWAVVYADTGAVAFFDMLVFIALLASGLAYAWAMKGLEWE